MCVVCVCVVCVSCVCCMCVVCVCCMCVVCVSCVCCLCVVCVCVLFVCCVCVLLVRPTQSEFYAIRTKPLGSARGFGAKIVIACRYLTIYDGSFLVLFSANIALRSAENDETHDFCETVRLPRQFGTRVFSPSWQDVAARVSANLAVLAK